MVLRIIFGRPISVPLSLSDRPYTAPEASSASGDEISAIDRKDYAGDEFRDR